jgi:hypothetical protein
LTLFLKKHFLQYFFGEYEAKGILNLPERIKDQITHLGYGCKAALYNISEQNLNILFENITRKLRSISYDFEKEFLPVHREQIRFLVKLINMEFSYIEKGEKSNESNGGAGGKRLNRNPGYNKNHGGANKVSNE